jgi:hypothetical protein
VEVLVGDDRQNELSCNAVRDRRVDVDRVVRQPDAVASRNKTSLKLEDVDLTGLWRQCEDPAARQDLVIGRDVVGKDGIVDVESADAVDLGLHGLAPLGPPGSVQGVAHAAGYGRLDVLVASGNVDEGAEAVSIERQRE